MAGFQDKIYLVNKIYLAFIPNQHKMFLKTL